MGCEKLKRNEGNDAAVKRLGPVSRCIHISLGYGTLRAQITLPTSFRELANACSPERVFTYSFKGYFDPRLPPPESSIFLPKNGISRFGEGMVEGMVSSFPLPHKFQSRSKLSKSIIPYISPSRSLRIFRAQFCATINDPFFKS